MIELRTPRGLPVQVPETIEEGPTRRFRLDQSAEIRRYYEEHGYVVIAGAVPAADCAALRRLWEDEVKPSGRHIYRQATARAERHRHDANGWVMNPILNVQSVDPKRYGGFRRFGTERVLAGDGMASALRLLLGDEPQIVQSMYFEGNSVTWEHQDSYYLDSTRVGTMVGAWLALEPIEATAGRFFVCPGSHRVDFTRHGFENNIVDNHDVYIASVVAKVRELGMEIRAPRLETGDLLLFNALTIHGSLDSRDERHSRASMTCHAIAAGDRLLQFQAREHVLRTDRVNSVRIYRPKDLARIHNRARLWVESRFPGPFYWLKRRVIRHLTRRASARRARASDKSAAAR